MKSKDLNVMKYEVEEVSLPFSNLFLFELGFEKVLPFEFYGKMDSEISKILKPYYPVLYSFMKIDLKFNVNKISDVLRYLIKNGISEVITSFDNGGEFVLEMKYKKGARKYLTDFTIVYRGVDGYKKSFIFRYGAKRKSIFVY